MLNLEKIQTTYNDRKKLTKGFTCVAFYCAKKENWFDLLTTDINNTIKSKIQDKYFDYSCHKHITIIGLEGINVNGIDKICKNVKQFPSIKIKSCKFQLLENGLIVGEFYPVDEDKEKLKNYRLNFGQLGIYYKHPNAMDKCHAVLGQLIPDKMQRLSTTDIINIEKEINSLLHNFSRFLKNATIKHNDIKILEYTTTTLKDAEEIKC